MNSHVQTFHRLTNARIFVHRLSAAGIKARIEKHILTWDVLVAEEDHDKAYAILIGTVFI